MTLSSSQIKRTTQAIQKVKGEKLLSNKELEEEREDRANLPRQTMRGYSMRSDVRYISLGFQPPNLVTFDILKKCAFKFKRQLIQWKSYQRYLGALG